MGPLVEGAGEGFFSRSLLTLEQNRPAVVGPVGHLLEDHLESFVPAGDLPGVLGQGRPLGKGRDVLHNLHDIFNTLMRGVPEGKDGNLEITVGPPGHHRGVTLVGFSRLKHLLGIAEVALFRETVKGLVAGKAAEFIEGFTQILAGEAVGENQAELTVNDLDRFRHTVQDFP